MSEINETRMESAMRFLAESDQDFAQEKVQVERSEILRKRIRARIFLASTGTVVERQARAEIDAESEQADDDYCKTIAAYELLKARRQRAELVIDVWRSLEASRRKT